MDPTTANALTAPLSSAMTSVSGVNNHWQIIYTLIIGVFAVIILWILKIAKNSEKLTETEKKAAEERQASRNAQIDGLDKKIEAEAKRVDQVFANHFKDHEKLENSFHENIGKLEAKMARIESEMHSISLNIARILTVLEMSGGREMIRREHNE